MCAIVYKEQGLNTILFIILNTSKKYQILHKSIPYAVIQVANIINCLKYSVSLDSSETLINLLGNVTSCKHVNVMFSSK